VLISLLTPVLFFSEVNHWLINTIQINQSSTVSYGNGNRIEIYYPCNNVVVTIIITTIISLLLSSVVVPSAHRLWHTLVM